MAYSGVFRFESVIKPYILTEVFRGFPQCFKSTCGIISRLGHEHVLILPKFSITNYPVYVCLCVCARERACVYVNVCGCVCVCVCV